jgi:putative ABC transport system permease protein
MQVKTGFQQDDWLTIVGIVGDIHQHGLESGTPPQIYRCYLQAGTAYMSLVVQTIGDPMNLAAAVRSQIASVDKDQPPYDLMTLERRLSTSLTPRKVNMLLLGCFAALALVLAAVGIYSVVSYLVTQRTHEIGIRIALGAERRDVLKMVVGQSLGLFVIGVAVGLTAAFGATRLLSSLLFGTTATDPIAFTGVPLLMIFVALLASYIPSRHASRIDPMIALRDE